MRGGMRHIGTILPVALLGILEARRVSPDQPAPCPSSCAPSSASSNTLNRCDTGIKDAQDVGYFTQARGYFTQGDDGGPTHVG
ncbi:MAG: hypothetical protein LKI57_09575 [Acetobacter lovaniensis]|jgi:hypothetical protein|nr:hypothetical protein [Acetobacter lovaniensis]